MIIIYVLRYLNINFYSNLYLNLSLVINYAKVIKALATKFQTVTIAIAISFEK